MRRGPRAAVAALVVAVAVLASAGTAAAAASWRLAQPAPPAGAPFKVPLGAPGDLTFFKPNAGLLAVQGNEAIARGLYFWNGAGWHQLSTVCGGSGDTERIAWAAADEFWVVTEPSQPRSGSGLGLCHFKGGKVVGSYSTPPQSPDPYRSMNAGACNGPGDCWFGGIASQDPSGQRVGAFHLHWDGTSLKTVYAPQGRGVSDLVNFGGVFYESVLEGVLREDAEDPVVLADPEPDPRLIHRIAGASFLGAPFIPVAREDVPRGGTELLAADAAPGNLWFAGGGAASGPAAPPGGGAVPRPPLAVHLSGPFFQEVAIPDGTFSPKARFGDVAAVPGGQDAWVTVVPYADRASKTAKATVAHLGPDGHVLETDVLPASGAGRGVAARIAFTGPNDGWMVTQSGWVFHYTDGTTQPVNPDPAFATPITSRPNESAEQFVPDDPPVDDSIPPYTTTTIVQVPKVIRVKALLKDVRTRLRVTNRGRTLHLAVSFTNRRNRHIQLICRHGRRVVARSPWKRFKPGRHVITVPVSRKAYPTALAFHTDDGKKTGGGGSQTVTTRAAVPSPDPVVEAGRAAGALGSIW